MLSGGEGRRGLRCLATESGGSPDEEDFFRKDDHQFFSMVWLSIWLNLLIEILFHSLVYLGNFGIYVMYSPHS